MSGSKAIALLLFLLGISTGAAWAAEPEAASETPNELQRAFAAAESVSQKGPTAVKLRDQAVLNLPAGYVFIPPPAASKVMTAMGNSVGDNFLGLLLPQEDAGWFVVAEYESSGYIKDDDAKK